MTIFDKSALLRAAMLGAFFVVAPALAIAEPAPPLNPGLTTAQDRADELTILQNQLQRQQFQQQQQQFRQTDRQQAIPLDLQRPQVPSLGANCRTEIFGNSYIRTCR
jgi:hypothetical protein